jgi:hypothetical protein
VSFEEYKQLSQEKKTVFIQKILDKKNFNTETSANKKTLLLNCLSYLQDETDNDLKRMLEQCCLHILKSESW